MIPSRSTLSRSQIVAGLCNLVASDAVVTEAAALQAASVDRFKKYAAVHGIFAGPIPAAIVMARSTDEVAKVLEFANRHLINVVPRTGGTGTEGGLETIVEDTIVLDCSAMNAIVSIDAENMQATAQCGVPLQVLEDAVRALGLTTGHSPQSKPIAQMGGLVATRSIGQFSTMYGAIEDMVVGLEAVFPGGTVTRIKNVPRRAAGPDIRHIVIGNEGALCVITEVTVNAGARWLGMKVGDIGALQSVLVVGSTLRKEHPLIANRLRQAAKKGLQVNIVHVADDDLLMKMANKAIVRPGEMANLLGAIAKALVEIKKATLPGDVANAVAALAVTPEARAIAQNLAENEKTAVFLGNFAQHHPQYSLLHVLGQEIARLTGGSFGLLGEAANNVGAAVLPDGYFLQSCFGFHFCQMFHYENFDPKSIPNPNLLKTTGCK